MDKQQKAIDQHLKSLKDKPISEEIKRSIEQKQRYVNNNQSIRK